MADQQPRTADDIKSFVDDRGIRFVRLWFTDILGQLKSFSINAQELDDAFEGGMGFDGSSITGFNAIEESDMVAIPDPSTFQLMPAGEGDGMATVKLTKSEATVAGKALQRLQSDPANDAETGADLGAGPGAGKITGGEDKGSATDVNNADKTKAKI